MHRSSRRFAARIVFILAFVALGAPGAELVFFASGRSLSVKGHQLQNGSLVLSLRGGGEIICEPATIVRIEPDEVPYPEEPAAPTVAADRAPRVPGNRPDYSQLIDSLAAAHKVDARLVRAVIQVESAYQ
jgi:hypothetical protein